MKTQIGISLLVVGLVIGISASAVLSLGTAIGRSNTTSTSVSTVFNTAVVTLSTTVQETLAPMSTVQSQSSPVSSQSTNTVAASSNVTISGIVNVASGTPTSILLTTTGGMVITLPVLAGGELSASVPNNQTYSVIIYFTAYTGGASSCQSQSPLYVYSESPVLAVDISC